MIDTITGRLIDNGYAAYLVGGVFRDLSIGKEPTDYDIATNATPDELIKLFSDKKVNTVGKSFGVVLIDNVEVATFRKDRFNERLNAKSCSPIFAETIEEDLARRDLTINAIAVDIKEGEVIDKHGGINDIENRIIRFVGDPYERIEEDPCRILRACRFFALMSGSFEKQTLQALKDRATYVRDHIAPDRIRNEILKAMTVEYPSLFFGSLYLIGALRFIFKALDTCFEHYHGDYHIETISEHLMLTGDNLSPRDPVLRLAGYLHDIGKPYAFIEHNGDSFVQHEKYGSNIAKRELGYLHFSKRDINRICNLIYVHMRPCRSLKKSSARRLQKHLSDLNVDPRDYIRLKLADRTANIKNDDNRLSMIKPMLINTGIVSKEEDLPLTVKDLALSGGEIIEIFKLKPGPKIGQIQRELLDYVITYGEERNNKEHLIDIARLYI